MASHVHEIHGNYKQPLDAEKGSAGMWQALVGLAFLAVLLGAAIVANVSDGPMREHRGSWVTHASK